MEGVQEMGLSKSTPQQHHLIFAVFRQQNDSINAFRAVRIPFRWAHHRFVSGQGGVVKDISLPLVAELAERLQWFGKHFAKVTRSSGPHGLSKKEFPPIL